MTRHALFAIALLAILAGALALRLPHLSSRPMHNDEAVNTIKFQALLEDGRWTYDPYEYHGPTLAYATLVSAWVSGAGSLTETTESTFRWVNVAFGVGLIGLLWLVRDGLGRGATLIAALLCAISPAMVYYSRFHVHEMLLVFFSFAAIACGWRYVIRPSWGWAMLGGASVGLMHATKETCIIAWFAMVAAAVVTWWSAGRGGLAATRRWATQARHGAVAPLAAIVVSITLFSSFFTHWQGPIDSVLTYGTYFGRGAGHDTVHVHPWHYYLGLVGWTHRAAGPIWSEGLVLVLATIGIFATCVPSKPGGQGDQSDRASFRRFIAVYSLLMVIVYSALPYKTPWLMLGFWHGLILLAGVGAMSVINVAPGRVAKGMVAALLLGAGVQLGMQTLRTTGRFEADGRNPYVYAHTSRDLLKLVARVDEVAEVHPDGRSMLIRVIAPNPWPLPWYLREYDRVGYWQSMPVDVDAAVVVVDEELARSLPEAARQAYHVEYYAQRPQTHMLAYIESEVWQKLVARRVSSFGSPQ